MGLKTIKVFILFSIITTTFSACYYDNKEELYPLAGGTCDTSVAVSYSKDIAPIMNLNCSLSGCHNAATHAAGITTSSYTDLVSAVNGKRFVGAVEWTSGFSPMPKGSVKLSNCNLNKINAWINAKMPNN
jgi:hypothetical protein